MYIWKSSSEKHIHLTAYGNEFMYARCYSFPAHRGYYRNETGRKAHAQVALSLNPSKDCAFTAAEAMKTKNIANKVFFIIFVFLIYYKFLSVSKYTKLCE